MDFSILQLLSALSPILTRMSSAAGQAQDTNALIGNNSAASRPGIVAGNLSNSRIASMMQGYTKPSLKWGGPGSVAHGGSMPTIEGGFGKPSADTTALEEEVQRDALNQAKSNYGIKDPSSSSIGQQALGAAADTSSILGVLSKLKPGGGPGPASGSAGGPGSPGTFGTGPLAPGTPATPGASGTPFDIADQGGPTDMRAYGSDAISELLRRLGASGGLGGASSHDGGDADGTNPAL